jgi:inward rectifier potassium channel
MTVETLVGLMTVALTTGVLFARVSRPTARVLFADVAVVNHYNGQPALMVRMGNARRSQIIQAEVSLTMLRNEVTAEGQSMRRFYDLPLARARTPVFAMSYTAMHFIDEDSPLYGLDAQDLATHDIELLVTVNGLDETMGQQVHARASYLPAEVIFGHRYADMFGVTEDGRRAIDYARFHSVEKIS